MTMMTCIFHSPTPSIFLISCASFFFKNKKITLILSAAARRKWYFVPKQGLASPKPTQDHPKTTFDLGFSHLISPDLT